MFDSRTRPMPRLLLPGDHEYRRSATSIPTHQKSLSTPYNIDLKICRNGRKMTDYSVIATQYTDTLVKLKRLIINDLLLHDLTPTDISLAVFDDITDKWVPVDDSNPHRELLALNINDWDCISFEKISSANSLSSLHNDYKTILEIKYTITLRLCEKAFSKKHFSCLFDLPLSSTIKYLKQKSIDKLQLYSIDEMKTTLFVYDDNKKWTEYDNSLDDCTLQELHFKDSTWISIDYSDTDIKNNNEINKITHTENGKKSDHSPSPRQRYPPGLCGLTNSGNTCYMNSALQCLSNIPALTDYYLNLSSPNDDGDKDNRSVTDVYTQLVKQIWSGDKSSLTPKRLKKAISKQAVTFADNRQKDSHEFMILLLNTLEAEAQQPSIIDRLFHGQIASTVKQHSDGYVVIFWERDVYKKELLMTHGGIGR
ncbi:unnamed protein product [Didymodactylos carnosus]|uniref:ubiquitinyl hydrolase 1 n=1 Tax=Didymodactylos carnosus TaxID=1234261 RepID=A0A815ANK1_9BILA|nr:unnamed protein product [Didymodactylos carnosus]CAF4037328.1 unnamed protein product [Didymodactylos carnosus]